MIKRAQHIIFKNGIFFAMILVFFLLSFMIPTFATVRNIGVIAVGRVPVGMFALALLIPLAVGEFDISLGYMIGAVMMIGGKAAALGANTGIVVLTVITTSLLFGVVNGCIAVYFKIPSTISTLGTGMVMYGISLAVNGGKTFTSVVPEFLLWIGKTRIVKLNISVWVFLVVAALLVYVLEYTPFGKYLYEIGISEQVVNLAGVKTKCIRFFAFVLSGFIIGLCAIILLTQSSSISPNVGPSYLLPGLAATFLSISMHDMGRYNVKGVVVSVFFLGVIFNSLSIFGVPFWMESLINGVVLLLVVLVAGITHKRKL